MVNKMTYTPEQGDLVYLNFTPHEGVEQRGRRPAITLSPLTYNQKVGLGIFCPITSKEKGYPFEVKLSSKLKTNGVILSDHVKSLDWEARKATFIEKASPALVDAVLQKLSIIFAG